MKTKLSYLFAACLIAAPIVSLPAHAAPPAKSSSKADKAAARITGSKNYLPVTGLLASIPGERRFGGLFAIDIGLDIPDEKVRKKAESRMPRLKSEIRSSISSYMSGMYEVDTVPNLIILSNRMQKATDRVLGSGNAKVTIASAIIHPPQ